MPIRLKLTLIFSAMLAVVIAAAGLLLVVRLRAELRSTIDDSLRSRAELIKSALELPEPGPPAESLIESEEAFAQIVGPDGAVEESSSGLLDKPLLQGAALERLTEPQFFQREVKIGNEEFPARLLGVNLGNGRILIVGSSLEDLQETVNVLGGLLLFGGPALVGLAAMIVWSVTGAALRPVERLQREAAALSISEVGRSLTVPETDDEIARLARSLNGLLARLGQALERERRFVDDASHELRTPVSTLKSELELALSNSTTQEEMRSAVERALADTDYLALLTEDLLVFARADGGRLPVRRSEVDLSDLVRQVVAGFKKRAESQGVAIQVEVEGSHWVDPLRLRQVLNNLLDNALRHGGAVGSIWVKTAQEDGTLVLEVEDSGSGFTGEALPPSAPSERPAREAERGRGLSIVKAIVEAHGGSVELGNRAGGGARVRLRFPSHQQI